MRVILRPAVFAVLLIFAQAMFAQTPRKSISSATRQVAIFSELENKLETAFAERDSATLAKLLSDDFEVWSPRPSGDPIARDEWLQLAPELRPQSFHVRQMAVRTFGNLYVVSFVLNEIVSGLQQTHFVVDVWTGEGAQARLQVRYEAPEPGKDKIPNLFSGRPTGKQ